MEVDLIGTAIEYMVLGMGVVFLFLVVMVWVLKIQSKLVQKFFSKQSQNEQTPTNSNTNNKSDKSKKVAAITATIAFHNR